MSLSQFEALTTLIGGPDHFQQIEQRDNAREFDRLPRNRSGYPSDDRIEAEMRAVAERLGFKFGEIIDDLFVTVTPPEGWRLKPTDHGMYSDLIDEQGRVRGRQMYKAAFYDRDASISFYPRYVFDFEKPEDWFQRSYPTQPERLFTVEKRLVRMKKAKDGYDYDDYEVYPPDPFHFPIRRPRFVEEEVKVYLPEDQQPKPITPRGYYQTPIVRDRATGEAIWRGETFYHPVREEDPKWAFVTQEREEAARVAAVAWLESTYPDRDDPAAYW